MNFKNNINIKKIIICLFGIMIAAYAIGAVIFFTFGKFSSVKYSKAKTCGISRSFEHKYNYSSNKNMNLNGVDEISIDFCFGNIKFNNNTTNDIKVNVDGKIIMSGTHKPPELKCYKKGRILYVELKGKGISLTRDSDIEASISIPNSYKSSIKIVNLAGDIDMSGREFKSINCKLDAGRLKLEDISADTFKYENYAGDLKADNLKTKNSNLKVTAGKIGITKFAGNVTASNSMGDIEIQYDKFNNNADLSAAVGQIQLTLPKTAAFKLDAATDAGDIKSDFSDVNVSGDIKKTASGIIGKSSNAIKLQDKMGDIKINNY